ncbi:hypothetical protein VCUG_02428 [Vavraia culicis subsp. floridensis]|uniref:Uncharacterized protein n=1 Tax=Vavraia culicis (isolate floridensis) TaxID=948595 RepID=L2GS10_VAVCU|nr:uncharacterized protein VCUG_02428 [Vavraia culicis subsp. floridensis]ELA46093.1 hypothetical protein VCUG_02428 [Vavraia culicis subsp. floridensis]
MEVKHKRIKNFRTNEPEREDEHKNVESMNGTAGDCGEEKALMSCDSRERGAPINADDHNEDENKGSAGKDEKMRCINTEHEQKGNGQHAVARSSTVLVHFYSALRCFARIALFITYHLIVHVVLLPCVALRYFIVTSLLVKLAVHCVRLERIGKDRYLQNEYLCVLGRGESGRRWCKGMVGTVVYVLYTFVRDYGALFCSKGRRVECEGDGRKMKREMNNECSSSSKGEIETCDEGKSSKKIKRKNRKDNGPVMGKRNDEERKSTRKRSRTVKERCKVKQKESRVHKFMYSINDLIHKTLAGKSNNTFCCTVIYNLRDDIVDALYVLHLPYFVGQLVLFVLLHSKVPGMVQRTNIFSGMALAPSVKHVLSYVLGSLIVRSSGVLLVLSIDVLNALIINAYTSVVNNAIYNVVLFAIDSTWLRCSANFVCLLLFEQNCLNFCNLSMIDFIMHEIKNNDFKGQFMAKIRFVYALMQCIKQRTARTFNHAGHSNWYGSTYTGEQTGSAADRVTDTAAEECSTALSFSEQESADEYEVFGHGGSIDGFFTAIDSASYVRDEGGCANDSAPHIFGKKSHSIGKALLVKHCSILHALHKHLITTKQCTRYAPLFVLSTVLLLVLRHNNLLTLNNALFAVCTLLFLNRMHELNIKYFLVLLMLVMSGVRASTSVFVVYWVVRAKKRMVN